MIYKYQLHEIAQQEYEASVIWYLERSLSAAENFIEAVESTIRKICENPTRWHNK